MQLYIYAKSGHNFGLENIRRASAVCNYLKDLNPILCSADYRAATYAKQTMGVEKGVGVDVIGNLPHIMERGDILIFDESGEASDTMKTHMGQFCTHLYSVGKNIPYDVVDSKYFEPSKQKYEKAIFFADDDYNHWFFNLCKESKKQDIPLLLGHYFFLGDEDILKDYFSDIYEDEEYEEIVKNTKYLLTSSVHTALESLSSGNNPVYFKREDKDNIENIGLLDKYNIPIIETTSLDNIILEFEKIVENYPTVNKLEQFDFTNIYNTIKDTLEKYAHIKPSLEYKNL